MKELSIPLFSLICAVAALSPACSFTKSSANIADLTIGRSMETRPEVLSFETMEPIYAVVKVENGIGNQLDIRVVVEGDVVNKGPGGLVMNKTVDIEARKPLFLSLAIAFPGRYRVEAVIIDPSGNQLDSLSKSITVTGEPPRPEDEESEREGDLG